MQKCDKQDVGGGRDSPSKMAIDNEITIVLSKKEAIDTIRMLEGMKRRIQLLLNK